MISRRILASISILSKITTPTRPAFAGYKSQYSIDKLYPQSDPDFTKQTSLKHTQANNEAFSGYIPMDDLDIRYARSSGPGGQHVNKVNTKVEIRFHVESAQWIPDFAKPRLLQNERGRLTKEGFLIMRSEKTRKQVLNQADCLEKIRSIVWEACIQPKEPTEEEMQLIEKRKAKAKQQVLREKRTTSLKKQYRNGPGVDAL